MIPIYSFNPTFSYYPFYLTCVYPPRRKRPNKMPKKEISHRPNNLYSYENNQKRQVPSKNIDVKDIDIYEYIQDHNITETRDNFRVDSYRINRILREKSSKKHFKRKTDEIIDEFIVETASSGIIYSSLIAVLIYQKFDLSMCERWLIQRIKISYN